MKNLKGLGLFDCCKIISMLLLFGTAYAQKTVRYDLYVSDTIVNYTGKAVSGIAINGKIPAPTLYFTEGDTAEIYVHNRMCMETSIHWHGIILPNNQDGVPYLTNAPIKPHQTFLYKFPIVQNGTYWYHSHTMMQEQSGLHGAIIIHKRNETPMPEYVVLLSDWTNEKPEEVQRSLKTSNDWYSIKKRATQNWGQAIITGNFEAKAKQEWLRMLPMDVSDVYYNAFHINGKPEQVLSELKAGDKIKLRIINGSSSTYFWLQSATGRMRIVASDGRDVMPVEVDRMLIAIAETYDVIITIPDNKCFEFKATAEDRTGFASLWLGNGTKASAPVLAPLKYFEGMKMMDNMMKLNGRMESSEMQMSTQRMDMNSVMYPETSAGMDRIITFNYTMLRSLERTTLPKTPLKTLKFELTGNMNRYQWDINNLPISEADKISIKKGSNVRIIFYNASMMRHPMHLHGHYFRVLNGQGDYTPLKNVLDIMPMETDTVEFNANADGGDWFMHCHILYHMMSGMGRVFSYENSIHNPQLDSLKNPYKRFLMDDKRWYFTVGSAVQSQALLANAMMMNRHYEFDATGAVGYNGNYVSETHFGKFLDRQQFLKVYIGTDIRDLTNPMSNMEQNLSNSVEQREVAVLGVQYLLPFFLQTELRVDNTGRARFQVSRHDLSITSRLRFEV